MRVAFVYAGGREERRSAAREGRSATEFFYGAIELERRGWGVEFIDVGAAAGAGGWLAGMLDGGLGWVGPVKMRGEELIAVAGLVRRLNRFDCVIGTATGLAMALGVLSRLGWLRARLVGIHCGLVNFPAGGARQKASSWALAAQRCVLFAESERAEVEGRFGVKAKVNPFGVDVDFWTPGADGVAGDFVLAVGNDARRDYGTLVEAVRGAGERVKILTNRDLPADLPENVEQVRGSWHRPAVSDEELRDLYRAARVVVVPLEDSIQPAGQSVALQAMACGKTVVMSRTKGLWTGEDFVEGEHLRLVPVGEGEALREAMERPGLDGRVVRERVVARGGIAGFAERLGEVMGGAGPAS
jgi:glycosyltransferase involved in cell wall biosynthesis